MVSKLNIEHINIATHLSVIERWVNFTFNAHFNAANPLKVEIDSVKYLELFFNGQVKVSRNENLLCLEIPLDITAVIDFPIATIEAHTGIIAGIEIAITINQEIKIGTQTKITQFTWAKGLDFTPRIVDMLMPEEKIKSKIEEMLPEMAKKIDEILLEKLDIGELTKNVQWAKSIKLPNIPTQPLFLNFRPEFIRFSNVDAVQSEVFQFAFSTSADFSIDDHPSPIVPEFVPIIQFGNKNGSVVESEIHVELPIEQLGNLIFAYIKSNPAIEKNLKCQVSKVISKTVSDSGIAIALKLGGIVRGALSIVGEPVFDNVTGEIDISNLRINFNGQDWASSIKGQAAIWLLRGFMKRALPFSLNDFIIEKVDELKRAQPEIKLPQHLALDWNMEKLLLSRFQIQSGNIIFTVNLNPRFELIFSETE